MKLKMKLGENILKLRKRDRLSQEELAEKINVTRQTISNWELGETSPNPEQLKLLSRLFKVSIDELLDNDTKEVLVEKVSNTEKLAGIIIKILKFVGITFLILLAIEAVALIMFLANGSKIKVSHTEEFELECVINNKDYLINVGSDGYFNCSNCDKELQKKLKDQYVDFGDLSKTEKNITDYFKSENGYCK